MKRKATTSSAQSDIQLHIHNWNSCESYVDTDKSQSHSILFFLQHYCFQSKRSFWFIFFVIFFLVICFILVLTLFKEQASLCSYVESFVAEQNTENNCFHNGILIFNPVTVTETKLLKCFQSLKNHFAQFLETTPNLADTALDSIRHSLFYETFWDLGSYIYVKDIFIRSLCSKNTHYFTKEINQLMNQTYNWRTSPPFGLNFQDIQQMKTSIISFRHLYYQLEPTNIYRKTVNDAIGELICNIRHWESMEFANSNSGDLLEEIKRLISIELPNIPISIKTNLANILIKQIQIANKNFELIFANTLAGVPPQFTNDSKLLNIHKKWKSVLRYINIKSLQNLYRLLPPDKRFASLLFQKIRTGSGSLYQKQTNLRSLCQNMNDSIKTMDDDKMLEQIIYDENNHNFRMFMGMFDTLALPIIENTRNFLLLNNVDSTQLKSRTSLDNESDVWEIFYQNLFDVYKSEECNIHSQINYRSFSTKSEGKTNSPIVFRDTMDPPGWNWLKSVSVNIPTIPENDLFYNSSIFPSFFIERSKSSKTQENQIKYCHLKFRDIYPPINNKYECVRVISENEFKFHDMGINNVYINYSAQPMGVRYTFVESSHRSGFLRSIHSPSSHAIKELHSIMYIFTLNETYLFQFPLYAWLLQAFDHSFYEIMISAQSLFQHRFNYQNHYNSHKSHIFNSILNITNNWHKIFEKLFEFDEIKLPKYNSLKLTFSPPSHTKSESIHSQQNHESIILPGHQAISITGDEMKMLFKCFPNFYLSPSHIKEMYQRLLKSSNINNNNHDYQLGYLDNECGLLNIDNIPQNCVQSDLL